MLGIIHRLTDYPAELRAGRLTLIPLTPSHFTHNAAGRLAGTPTNLFHLFKHRQKFLSKHVFITVTQLYSNVTRRRAGEETSSKS